MASLSQYRPADYTVGWLCSLLEELEAARRMLDSRHKQPILNNDHDHNQYYFGDVYHHKVVIAPMPLSTPGTLSAQRLVQPLKQTFPNMVLHLFVGVGGGIPRIPRPEDPCRDIHLGDVVVGWPEKTGAPAVVQHDFIRSHGSRRDPELLNRLDKPDDRLIPPLTSIVSDRGMDEEPTFELHLQKLAGVPKFKHPGLTNDRLFEADSPHPSVDPGSCRDCTNPVARPARATTPPQLHLGTILTGNKIVQEATERDELRRMYEGAVCIEMEAAGVNDTTHCLVIRGISDYADSHRVSLNWHHYAAGTAAALAREILRRIRPTEMQKLRLNENASNIRSKINKKFDQGKDFYSRFQSNNLATDLESALRCLKQAHNMLVNSSISDPSLNVKILFRLITLEVDYSHNEDINLDDKIAHTREAQDYAVQALSLTDEEAVIAQIRLEQAFAEGRQAELERLRGADTAETRRVMEKVKVDMDTWLTKLRALNPNKSNEYEKRVANWQERLQLEEE